MPIVFARVYTGILRKGDSVVSVSPPESAAQMRESNKALSGPVTPSAHLPGGMGLLGNSPAALASAAAAAANSPWSLQAIAVLPRERPQKLLEISADNLSLELPYIESGQHWRPRRTQDHTDG